MSENARIEESFRRTNASHREYPMRAVMILIVIGGHMKIEGPLKEEDTKVRMGNYQDRGYSERGYTGQDGRLTGGGGPPGREDPLIKMEDPLMMEDPGRWTTTLIPWRMRTTRTSRTSWTCKTSYSTNTPGNIGHNCFGKYI